VQPCGGVVTHQLGRRVAPCDEVPAICLLTGTVPRDSPNVSWPELAVRRRLAVEPRRVGTG
jgi:hypothetical protein